MPGDVLGGSWVSEGKGNVKEEEREKNEEEQTDVGQGGEVDVGRLRNVVGAEIRGIGGIMGGSFHGQYQSVQAHQFTFNHNHLQFTIIIIILTMRIKSFLDLAILESPFAFRD